MAQPSVPLVIGAGCVPPPCAPPVAEVPPLAGLPPELTAPPDPWLPPVTGVPPLLWAPPLPCEPPVPLPLQGGLSHLQVPLSQRGAVAGQRLLQSPQELLLYLTSVQAPPHIFWLVSQQTQALLTQ